MNRSIDEIYSSISQVIFKGTDGLFSNAILEVELHSLAMKLSGGYYSTYQHETASFSFIKEQKQTLLKDFLELQNTMPNEQWNIMTYTLDSSGGHKVDFEWNKLLAEDIKEVCAAL